MVFGFIGATEVIVILVIALLVFGPQKLPEISKQIGSAYREMNRMRNEVSRALEFDSYAQPYDMPTYDPPASGTTYAQGSYDYGSDVSDPDYTGGSALMVAPPGPRIGQENVTVVSLSEDAPEVAGVVETPIAEAEVQKDVEARPTATAAQA